MWREVSLCIGLPYGQWEQCAENGVAMVSTALEKFQLIDSGPPKMLGRELRPALGDAGFLAR